MNKASLQKFKKDLGFVFKMKRGKFDSVISVGRLRSIQILMGLLFFYLLIMSLEMPIVLKTGLRLESSATESSRLFINVPVENKEEFAQKQVEEEDDNLGVPSKVTRKMGEFKRVSGLIFDESMFDSTDKDEFSELHKAARDAFVTGKKVWEELQKVKLSGELDKVIQKNETELTCPNSVIITGKEFKSKGFLMEIPCGMILGSHITVVGKPKWGYTSDPRIGRVSQFIMELQGLKNMDGEDPPRILHYNPRLKGDWSERPVIEQNTCYRQQWGRSSRCDGLKSSNDEETVDGQVKCEKWIRDDDKHTEESKTSWWLKRLIGRTKKMNIDWPFPFAEDKLFVLTLSTGLEGYHVNVDGRHVTSFPYRTGFTLEDATGLAMKGDVDVHSIVAASLPTSHPSFDPQRPLEMVNKWKAPSLSNGPGDGPELFIGILSAGNHFAERMAVRKSWMQHSSVKSSNIVARFFVAMHGRKEVNVELMKEADFFGDIVIVPYMDNYDLVVLKTVAICEYGVRTMGAKYIMKCDDDTFVRIDAVMNQVRKVRKDKKSLYLGNINYYHKPLRSGKWAVTYEEWPEEDYPPYANGPGYVVSSDIAHFVVSEFEKHKLRLFKMEDVSVGMWIEQFNETRPVEYVHSLKYCQFGCIEDYYTAHYQSPRQMICLWKKLQKLGKPQCCNM